MMRELHMSAYPYLYCQPTLFVLSHKI